MKNPALQRTVFIGIMGKWDGIQATDLTVEHQQVTLF